VFSGGSMVRLRLPDPSCHSSRKKSDHSRSAAIPVPWVLDGDLR
jgi:hypothetical protein